MILLLFYYIVLPLLVAGLVIKLIKKYAPSAVSAEMRALYAAHPLEKGFFRAARRDVRGLAVLGDFETKPEAVEAAYRGRERAQETGETAAFLILNDAGETLEEIES